MLDAFREIRYGDRYNCFNFSPLFAQCLGAGRSYGVVILDRTPADADRSDHFTLRIFQGDTSWKGNQPAVAVLDSK